MTNFLKKLSKKKKDKTPYKKIGVISLISLGSLVLLLALLGLLSYGPAKRTYTYATEAKTTFAAAQSALEEQDLTTAKNLLQEANASFMLASESFAPLRAWKIVPIVGTQVSAIDNVLNAVIQTGPAISELVSIADSIITPFTSNDELRFSHLTRDDKRTILKSITENQDRFEEVKGMIDIASDYIDAIPERGLIGPVKETITPLREQFTELKETINQVADLSGVFPRIAGYPDTKTYLFLLQNNTEMRPTGGFIGTYGILRMADGEILSFTTDNSYNLDSAVEDTLFIDPPWPLTRYNAVHQWFLRDANWSPDFPTAAQKAEEFYRLEGGRERIDGVIAVTPSLIESLLGLTGDITVEGIQFTQQNFVETLQFQVEKGFLRQEIPFEQRKDIIGPLSEELITRIFDLPQRQWKTLWSTIAINLVEKQVLFYVEDPVLQQKVLEQNWAGQIRETSGDYLMVVDANLASLKSDPAVKRTYTYTVDLSSTRPRAKLTITYTNTASLTWKTTRYRTYVRVYVPGGSELVSSDGEMVDCKLPDEGSVEVTQEYGKIVFGTFVCTEIGESRTLTYEYLLPETVSGSDEYTMLIQKQPGTSGHAFSGSFTFDKPITWIEPFDSSTKTGETAVTIDVPLRQDRNILIRHK